MNSEFYNPHGTHSNPSGNYWTQGLPPKPSTTAPAVIFPPVIEGTWKSGKKPCKQKEALNCFEIAARGLKQKVVIDFNPRHGFWTIKIGFIFGRDQDFVKAAQQCVAKVHPLL